MNSWVLDFRFDKAIYENKEIINLIENVRNEIEAFVGQMKLVYNDALVGNTNFTVLCKQSMECSVLLQGTDHGLFCIDIHTMNGFTLLGDEEIQKIRSGILECDHIIPRKTLEFCSLPAIKRGQSFSTYDKTSFNSLVEYDYKEIVFEEDSNYQNVRVMRSQQYGNCLVLDNDINLAESDLSYTVAITGNKKEAYEGKDVLILGGGDGGILNYLLNSGLGRPRMITMIEIDKTVMEAAKKHLRGICGNALDQYRGDNYEVVVGDCVPYLQDYVEEGKKFDFVINDLTAIPISTKPVGTHWEFLRLILSFSITVLKSNGKYITQGNGANNVKALEMYEEQLKMLQSPVSFSKETVCVPSYHEMWVFYTLWRTQTNGFPEPELSESLKS